MSLDDVIDQGTRLYDEAQYEQALQLAEAALAGAPSDRELLYLKCIALIRLGRFAESLPLSVQAVNLAPTTPNRWQAVCFALKGLGYADLALLVNAYALEHVAPDFTLARFRGEMLFSEGRYEAALAAYQSTLERFGEDMRAWQLWFNCSTCLYHLGRNKEARDAVQSTLTLISEQLAVSTGVSSVQFANLWAYQGEMYSRLKDWRAAEAACRRALSYDPTSFAVSRLYDAYRAQHKWLSAIRTFYPAVRERVSWKEHGYQEKQVVTQGDAPVAPAMLHAVRELISK